MQLRHLRTFATVAQTLNFTRAAERIHLAQSSVTEQIQALESDLGVPLFDRSNRRLTLTPAGERLVGYAAEMLRLAGQARSAVADAAGTVSGRLVVGGLETLCATRLPNLLAAFHRLHPAVDLTVKTADSGALRSGVRSGDVDVGFCFGDAPAGPEFRGEAVGQEDLLVMLPPNHRLAGRDEIGPEDLADEAFLVTQPGCVYRRMFDEAFAEDLPHRPKVVGEFASIGSIRGLVQAGLGCALAPRAALEGGPDGPLAVGWAGRHRRTPVTMIWRGGRPAAATAAFLAVARQGLEAQTRR